MSGIDPEGYARFGGDCICGPLYSYAGIIEPGGIAPDCPMHGDPEFYEKRDAAVQAQLLAGPQQTVLRPESFVEVVPQ
ncbi:hypothetical protein SEA_SCHMIDT_73 [Gordonia phage Schmidt]|uniref:Uncharacterized protein n=1 Tax=Gordonia phage Schmidt TaxID=2301697 RepID=A0A385E2W9_9CAUD|nr:hypothetical protein KDJ59_gp73 [Gordonia phage Schmidt]AXQ65192.1 hypothetical protein SEA_SCHMIDT_73 [Gordonia phage Schmidt]